MGTINSNNRWGRRRVGLIFDSRMCIHSSPDEDDHPENHNRIRAIWKRLNDSGLVRRCVVLDAKKAEDRHLALVHSKEHIDLIKTISSKSSLTMRKSAAKFDSIYFNGGSSTAAYLAAGSVIEVAEKVAKGELDSAFAVVRPPGHHAEQDKPMGFCLCNNIAIATSFLLNERPELGISKILIVDWDIHHGNGTQKMFYDDPRVLVFSVHRHESGRFYPHGNDGSYNMIGEGPGEGYNINVPWENGGCGDADYIAVWDHILIPVAEKFDPDMIIVSAGFDAAEGDPIGGCCVSSYGYTVMLDKLMGFASGKIVMALEGGYNPVSLADSTQSCIQVLLREKHVISSLENVLLKSTWCVIEAVRQALCRYWPALAATLPDKSSKSRPSQIEADAAIRDEVDFREQANEELSNERDKGTLLMAARRKSSIEALAKLNAVRQKKGKKVADSTEEGLSVAHDLQKVAALEQAAGLPDALRGVQDVTLRAPGAQRGRWERPWRLQPLRLRRPPEHKSKGSQRALVV